MEITHLGRVESSCQGSDFVFNDILVVPDANRNLMSVKKNYKDNHVVVEFDEQQSRVKDRESRKVLSGDQKEDGFYPISYQ